MKISFLIPAIVFYIVRVAFSTSVQVGTVLFSTTDLVKKCWTEPDKSLLKARLIMQDVLPDPDCIDFSNPEAVAILIDYFHSCYQIISTCTYGKLQNLMFIALSDALGGYLRAFVLPFARRSYYAGQLKYSEAKKLFQLYDDIRAYLKTNGAGWAEPRKISTRNFRVKPLVITGGALEACRELYSIEKPGKLKYLEPMISTPNDVSVEETLRFSRESLRENPEFLQKKLKSFLDSKFSPYRRKRKKSEEDIRKFNFRIFNNSSSAREKFFEDLAEDIFKRTAKDDNEKSRIRKSRGFNQTHSCSSNCMRTVIVPLPVLDDCNCPNSIAVPLKRQPFRNLKSRNSAFVLEFYYVAVIKCFIAKGNTRSDIKNFNAQFHSWLMSQVMPHLNDEQWYPGFGGVLRIIQTIKKFGVEKIGHDPTAHDIGFMFGPGSEFEVEVGPKGKSVPRDVNFVTECCPQKRRVLTTIIVVSLIWIFIFMACVFYCQATRGSKLLYEECSCFNASSSKRTDGKENINFQFFIKFFDRKKVNECVEEIVQRKNREEQVCLSLGTPKFQKDTDKPRKCEEIQQTGQGDQTPPLTETGPNIFQNLMSHVWPSTPILSSYYSPARPRHEERQKGQGDQVQMLWKKNSVNLLSEFAPAEGHEEFSKKESYESTLTPTESEITSSNSSEDAEDETKDYTIEKRSSICYCSETCPHSTTQTSTTISSTTQSQEESYTCAGYWKEMHRRSAKRKPLTENSTEESESELDYSSSEYDH